MMIESLNPDLTAHRGAPDKDPERRLATLDAAGELVIPFTTGILVGIGESAADRLASLQAIAASHRRYGHVQEVIVQNFLPKPGTTMRNAPPCPEEEFRRTIALARLVLPDEVHVQAPPNLSSDPGALLDAGIDDWGGVSPITPDHVNPERPWPEVERLRTATESRGLALAPRLTIYPEFARDPGRWLDETVRFAVLDRSDAEGLGRAPIYLKRAARRGPTWREVVLMHAVARIAYHGLIDNIQASWVKLGTSGAQQLLQAGVNDLGGTLMDENISRAAGAAHGQGLQADDFARICEPLGRRAVQRSTLYDADLTGAHR